MLACSRTSAPPPKPKPVVVEAKADADAAPETQGVCMKGATDFEAAALWANSFRLPGIDTSRSPKSLIIEPDEPSRSEVHAVLQLEIYEDAATAVMRQFVFVERGGAIAGCAISEERDKRWHKGSEDHRHIEIKRAALDGELATLRTTDDSMRDLDISCLWGADGIGCVSVREHRHVSHDAAPGGVHVKSEDRAIVHALVPFEVGASRVVDYDYFDGKKTLYATPVLGRPEGVTPKAVRKAAALEPLTPEQRRSWLGAFETRGPCIAKAATWHAAELWAESFRSDDEEEAREVSLYRADVSGTAHDHEVRTYEQRERFHMRTTVRGFVMIETSSGVSACLVTEDELAYGYLEAPTPEKGTLREAGADRFEYDAAHSWHSATGEDEEASWRMGCTVDGAWLGCVSIRTRWTDAAWENGKTVTKEYQPQLDRTPEGYRHQLDGKTLDLPLEAGKAISIWRDAPKVLVSRATLEAP